MAKTHSAAKEYTEQEVLAAIPDSYGIVSRVGENLGCTWGTARKYIDMYPSAIDMFRQEKERIKDLCEIKVIKAINLDDIQTAKWYLGMQAKDRGYVDRQELTGANGGPVSFSFDVSRLSPDEADAMLALMDKAKNE